MNCESFHEAILGYVSGELDKSSLTQLRRHFTECGRCADSLRFIEGQEALIKAAPRPKAPPGLWPRVQAQIADRIALRTTPFPARRVRWIAAAAAVLLAGVLVALSWPSKRPAGTPGGLDLRVVDVEDRAERGRLGRLLPGYGGSDPRSALDAVVRGDE